MLRHRRFLMVMHRLALMGALLMVVAPVISRWLQSHPPHASMTASMPMPMPMPMPTSAHAMSMSAMDDMRGMDHSTAMDMSMPMEHGDGTSMPPGHDGAACDYCVLAAGLLLFVLLLLTLPLLQPVVCSSLVRLRLPRVAAAWPAHAARGPPLQA